MHLLPILITSLSLVSAGFAAHADRSHVHRHPVRQQSGHTAFLPRANDSHAIRTVGYFGNWAPYGRNYLPQSIPADKLTHVLYAFADVQNETGEVYLTDLRMDVDMRFDSAFGDGTDSDAHGCVEQLLLHKMRNRNLKVLLSVGGWTYSRNFSSVASSESKRGAFAQSAVQIMEDVGFDGIDIDWEYPQNDEEAQGWVKLLASTRQALNEAQAKRETSTRFLLTVACPAGPQHYQQLRIADMDPYLDFWNLMAYDYVTGLSPEAGHQANLYPNQRKPTATPANTDEAIRYYTTQGVLPSKMVLGMPLYGRAFQNTLGPGEPFSEVGPGSWQDGVWDYKALPRSDVEFDPTIGASWRYDKSTQTMITYDTPEAVRYKAQYAQRKGLGGGMWWELSGDSSSSEDSLVEAFVQAYGGTSSLAQEMNCLEYPESKYDNIRTLQVS